jgi:uncharacterized protein YukE
MADIMLNHETVDNAVAEMQQATATMTSNLDALVQQLKPVADTFTGAAASAWTQFQLAANHADEVMHQDFSQGQVRLQEMHNYHKQADNKGASIFGG